MPTLGGGEALRERLMIESRGEQGGEGTGNLVKQQEGVSGKAFLAHWV
jgi:hypothetical protein